MSKKAQSVPKSFEDAIGELERIVADVEGGAVPLEQSLLSYERGAFLIQHCRQILDSAEKQVELLTRQADGRLVASPAPTDAPPATQDPDPSLRDAAP